MKFIVGPIITMHGGPSGAAQEEPVQGTENLARGGVRLYIIRGDISTIYDLISSTNNIHFIHLAVASVWC